MIIFTLLLWQVVSIACGEGRKLDETEKDFSEENATRRQNLMEVKKFTEDCQGLADEMRNEKESEYEKYLAIAASAVLPVVVLYVCYLKRGLKEVTSERDRLREQLSERELSERERFHNIQETIYCAQYPVKTQ